MEDLLYGKLLDIITSLRDAHKHFLTYSARDLVKLIEAALHNIRKLPEGINILYDLEKRIREVRELLEQEKLENLMGM